MNDTPSLHTLHKHTWKDGLANDIPIVIKYKHRSNKDVDLIYAIDNVRANDHKGSAKRWCQSFTPPEIQTPNPTYAIRKCTIPPSNTTHISDKPNSSNRETEEMRGKKTQRKLENELAYLMKYHVWSSLIRMPNSCARSPVIMSIKSSNFWLPLRWNSLTLMVHVSPQIPYRGQLFNASSWCHWFLWYFCVSKVEIVWIIWRFDPQNVHHCLGCERWKNAWFIGAHYISCGLNG